MKHKYFAYSLKGKRVLSIIRNRSFATIKYLCRKVYTKYLHQLSDSRYSHGIKNREVYKNQANRFMTVLISFNNDAFLNSWYLAINITKTSFFFY